MKRPLLPTLSALTVLTCALSVPAGDAYPTLPDIPAGKTRGEKATKGGELKYWPDRPDQAKVLSATFIGGKGHEWLASGGFQPDGTVVLVGNVCGGEFGLSVKETVLGSDGARPGAAEFKTDSKGKSEKPSWVRGDATGFIVIASSDLKTISKVVRLPWTSASITSCAIGSDGAIYIAGKATAGISSLGGTQRALAPAADATRKDGMVDTTFVAKLDKTASKVEWLCTSAGKSDAPSVRIGKGDRVIFGSQDLRFFDASGKEVGQITIPGGVKETTSVNPIDGTVASCGERNTGTGREPWRMGHLNILEPNGKLRYQLYQWSPRYVVMDTNRLVSDSPIDQVVFDNDGNLYATMFSDGGNSVNLRQPTDIGRGAPSNGLGLNTAGAHAGKFYYMVKIDGQTFDLLGWTMWMARYGGKPNGVKIETLCQVPDGSLAHSGGSAWGLIQTGNKLANCEPGGNYIAVFNPDFTGVRYSSIVPGSGRAQLGNGTDAFGIASGTVNGKSRVLFLSGACDEEDVYGLDAKTATKNAVQASFGGGLCDGYVVMLELGEPSVSDKARAKPAPIRLLVTDAGGGGGGKKDEPAPTSTTFQFSKELPKWTSADAEFRVADASKWPNFVIGQSSSGTVTMNNGVPSGNYTVSFTDFCQSGGKQDRRVLGELFQGDKSPALELAVASFGAATTKTATSTDNKGKTVERTVTCYPVDAKLSINGTAIKIPFEAVASIGKVVEKPWIKCQVALYATVKGSVLGLKGELADKDIDIRIRAQGIDPATVVASEPKKKK